ncbi:MAG TPA: polysaccharide deacetylase family protein [Hyphomicrobiaceae bacterium]|nr:polysaccharide deacetylase family protein [Hyphomicrobiaceae bacterium]
MARKNAYRLLGVIGLAVAGLCHPAISSGTVAAPQQCWAPGALSAKPGEATIRKGMRSAFVPVPRGTPRQPSASFQTIRGSIRRVKLPHGEKIVALTFDLCEQPYEITGYQGDIVDYLREQRIPATFFAGGKWMLTHTARAQQLMADPMFELANHSWEHRNFRLLDDARLAREIDGAQLAYEQSYDALAKRRCVAPGGQGLAHNAAPPRLSLFRFPFGACNARSLKAVNDRGLLAIQWDVSSADPWKALSADRMTEYVVSRAKSGSIIIFHANGRGWRTGEALPRIISGLKAKGFRFATVSQLLAMPGAEPVVAQTCYDAKPGDSDRYDELGRKLEVRYQEFYRAAGAEPNKR